MNGMNYDDWQTFLEQRDERAGWQWPLNLAVALHLAVFASAAAVQHMAGSGPGFRFDKKVSVNFVSLVAPAPPPAAMSRVKVAAKPAPKIEEELLPAPMHIKKAAEPKPLAQETAAKQPAVKEVEKAAVKAEPKRPIAHKAVEIKPEQPAKKIAEAIQRKPKAAPPAVQAKKEAVSLNPIKQKAKAAKLEAEKKAAAAEVKRLAEEKQARLAEAKKVRERIAAETRKTARIEAEKKAAAAEARRKIAAMEQRKALAEARRIEHEAQTARQAAVAAREQLKRALRRNEAISSAVAGDDGSVLGSGIGSGHGIGVGGMVALKQYASSLNEKISSRWKVPELVNASKKLKTVVALTVSKNGTIEAMKIEQKSGDAVFDQSVLKALRSAEPLPNFPALLDKPKLEFALNFTPQGLMF